VSERWTGRPIPPLEGRELVAGRGRYIDNLSFKGVLHMIVVRSPFAHAAIRSVDVGSALAVPGVVTAFSGKDLRSDWIRPLPVIWRVNDEAKVPEHWPLAVDVARFVGDGIAVVVGETLAAAQDGAEVVASELEPLPSVTDVESALEDGAVLVHPDLGTNRCFSLGLESGRDIEELFREADVVVARTFRQQRVLGSPMETRGVVAEPQPGGEFVLWTSTQIPHIVKRTLAPCVGIPEHQLRVVAPDVGGGFGVKLNVYAEEALALTLARHLRRPVKWIEQRTEHAQSTTHARAQQQRVELAATEDGRILGIRVSVLASLGAYLQLETPGIPIIGRLLFGGAYAVEGYAYDCTGVFTNQAPTGAYRGAGRPEAIYAIERMMDVLARAVGRDPVEIRRKNFLPDGQMVKNAMGIPYDSIEFGKPLDRALEMLGYRELRSEQERRRLSGSRRQLGIGISCYVDSAGLGSSAVLARTLYEQGGWEFGAVRVLPSGTVEVLTGTTPQGQGHKTVFAQLVADALGVDLGDVRVLHGDTALVPMGTGTFSSRSLIVGGTAIIRAATRVVDKATKIAAHLLEVDEGDVGFFEGRFVVAGASDRTLTMKDVARAAHVAWSLPEGVEPGLQESSVFDPPDWTYPFGTHAAVLEVDMDTGEVQVIRYVAVDDCGNVVNPTIVEGQIHGGVAQGIGQALFEEVKYSPEGQLETGSFLTYTIPSATELPSFELDRTVTPTSLNPLGAKGVGEAGTIGAPPAVMNALHDALETDDEIDMPASPERVWHAIRSLRSSDPRGSAAV
jgi:aerobic carbon-monoxide dehydrogenase large subunit